MLKKYLLPVGLLAAALIAFSLADALRMPAINTVGSLLSAVGGIWCLYVWSQRRGG